MNEASWLSPHELETLQDQDFFPLKFRICEKVEAQLQQLYQQITSTHKIDHPYFQTAGKLSKGENYQTYPYRVLDFPRYFSGDDMLLIRSMMLWGDAFSFHLILTGKPLEACKDRLWDIRQQAPFSFFIAQHESPWLWMQDEGPWAEWQAWQRSDWEYHLKTYQYLKISTFLPLNQAGEFEPFILENWNWVFQAIAPQASIKR